MEKVITVALQRQAQTEEAIRASLDELDELVDTAGGQVVESHTQKKDRPDPATFIGKGKAIELSEVARRQGVHTLVFDDELKPVQQRNIEELTGTKVVDRTRLILDIFAQRARTREGQLQVELAQLHYMMPRITQRFGRFEQQTGGIGTRGPGERKLEVDQRRVRDRMVALERDIEKVSRERALQRSVRRSVPVPQVALVGYTNAGKSTLLNTLLARHAGAPNSNGHRVYADDKLFATLDPTTRRVKLASGRTILFTDTVGFIRKLPTPLIAAFRATLEETAAADLLLHVLDVSDPDWVDHEKTVLAVLKDLQMDQLPLVTAYNKMDRLSPSQKRRFEVSEGCLVSAGTGENVDGLLQQVEKKLTERWVAAEVFVPYSDPAKMTFIHEKAEIIEKTPTDAGIQFKLRILPADAPFVYQKKNKNA